jgi:glycosyltransferase involved in cell wall biosynthesis
VIRFRPSLIHLSAPDLLGVQAQKLARRLRIPVVASLHTRFETYLGYYGLAWLRRSAERFLQDFYKGCDQVLAPNAPLMELLRRDGLGEKVSLWSRGVDRVQFSPRRHDMEWRRGLGIGDDEVAVLFLGRLVMEKGLDVFADTLAQLHESGMPVRPLVVGDGPARARLEARLPDGVFTGLLTGDELGRAVASADILLNPSRTEAFGNVTLESMAAGLAVVCPDAPSTHELIEDGRTGLIVDRHEADAYADAIAGLIRDPAARRRLGLAAAEASARYDWSRCSADVLETYRQVGGLMEPSCA